MAEPVPVVLNLRRLRERALRSRAELAHDVGVSLQLLAKLELGHGDTRVLLLFHLCVLLARYLDERPSQLWDELVPLEMYNSFEGVRQEATLRLGALETQRGNYRAKRRFLRRDEAETALNKLPEAVSLHRFQLLFAKSHYSQVELSLVTDISERRLNHIFAISAPRSGQLSVRVFLRLAAALAPVYDAGIKETASYLIGSDLEKLDAYSQARR